MRGYPMNILPRLFFLFLISACFFTLACDDGGKKKNLNNNNQDGGVDADVNDGDIEDDVPVDIVEPNCIEAEGTWPAATDNWVDGPHTATVEMIGYPCQRNFSHRSTQPLRDNQPANPRIYRERDGWPSVSTGNIMFDALYALSLEETRECSVSAIEDYAYNGGNPIQCPPGGCFETGRLWKFVWTRDTAYAVDLALAALDPTRSRNSLEFKVSERRSGGNAQIIQDTGSGGSYPVSTDRVVWAVGARQLLNFLDGAERQAFIDLSWEAVRNTLEQDRVTVYEPINGLYLGEQSFLDWREQTYPHWTATDTVQIHMSQALSTNVGHLALMELAVQLAQLKGDAAAVTRYGEWAQQLRTAIDDVLFQEDFGLWSTFTTGTLDRFPARHFDLLGSSLAILHDVGNAARHDLVVRNYPQLAQGPAVIWPQQKEIPIYHNRGIWPFVTAYWLRAALKVKNDAVINHNIHSLMRGAALNISNMENFDAVSGAPWFDDGPMSGPIVNSQRQLWSVAAYSSMVHDVIFGLEANLDGIRFLPFVTRHLRNVMFASTNTLVLNNFRYRGKTITVVVRLPAVGGENSGALTVGTLHLNGSAISQDFIPHTQLADENLLEITLDDTSLHPAKTMTMEEDVAEYRKLFAPLTPNITHVGINAGAIEIFLNSGGEATSDIVYHLYRDNERIFTALPGNIGALIDHTAPWAERSVCYTLESQFLVQGELGLGTVSQRARPVCFWGETYERITTFSAADFASTGGNYVFNHGRYHYESWGEPGHTLTVTGFTAEYTGEHLLQVLYGNGAGNFSTGITCVTKRVSVLEGTTPVGGGYFVMPHLATWNDWRDSSFVRVHLEAGRTYSFVIMHDDYSINMSDFQHNALYGGTGGSSGPHHFVNIAELKILSLSGI